MWAWDRYGLQVKRIVPDISFVCLFWILGFVFVIASAPCDFLYLNNEYMKNKKRKKKKKITHSHGPDEIREKLHLRRSVLG